MPGLPCSIALPARGPSPCDWLTRFRGMPDTQLHLVRRSLHGSHALGVLTCARAIAPVKEASGHHHGWL